MSAVLTLVAAPARRLALLGTGTVGTAFVQRYQALEARGVELPQFSWLANSRTARACEQQPAQALWSGHGHGGHQSVGQPVQPSKDESGKMV